MERAQKFKFDTFYHVFNRTNGYQSLFVEAENYRYFLNSYLKQISPFAETWAYCLMPTHFHFLIKIRPEAEIRQLEFLSDEQRAMEIDVLFLRKFSGFLNGYVHAFNNRNARHGTLFQRSLKRIQIDSNTHLETVMCYIHTNPVKDGLTKLPENWWYSSYVEYLREHEVIRDEELQLPNCISKEQKMAVLSRFGNLAAFKQAHQRNLLA